MIIHSYKIWSKSRNGARTILEKSPRMKTVCCSSLAHFVHKRIIQLKQTSQFRLEINFSNVHIVSFAKNAFYASKGSDGDFFSFEKKINYFSGSPRGANVGAYCHSCWFYGVL